MFELHIKSIATMTTISRRLFSSTASRHASAAETCSELLSRFNDKPVSVRTQLIDPNQHHLLNITLNRTSSSSRLPRRATPVPPGHHLVYFTPHIAESELGLDGSDRTVNPLHPFTRRMWAGGKLRWDPIDPKCVLKVGQHVLETTKLRSAEAKTLRNGSEAVLVGVEKIYTNKRGVALTDQRNWIFQNEITPENPIEVPPAPEKKALPEAKYQRDFCQTEVTLFRFSALTFNGHKIHYAPDWCRKVEGHRNIVVHGPLNLIHMLDFWRDTAREGAGDALPMSIEYRAMGPLYVGEPYRILLKEQDNEGKRKQWKVEIWDSYGKQSMGATIVE